MIPPLERVSQPALVRQHRPSGRQVWSVRIAGIDAGTIERCAADLRRRRREAWLAEAPGLPPTLCTSQAAAIDRVAAARARALSAPKPEPLP